ncbi:hypothetical protein DFP72DRAFT_1135513 [Ephemerocybe angulata]|uniref:FAD/NAD(P)-binding domain-containing protein n=1 Tax=Ephemerocybe angulata TaxID=980116 RepID=A0A8H6HTP4_9AGAR|nr:hypothetical protein DFP72DRAFT_1135513 [Tulosesus angulatus]
MSPPPFHPTVLIVGAGFAGVGIFNELSRKLDSKSKIILVNPRQHLVHLPAACRLIVPNSIDANFEDKVLLPFTSRFNEENRRTVYSKVTSIDDAGDQPSVTLENGEKIRYTYLVLAPGSLWEGPMDFPNTKEETLAHLKKWHDRFEKANDIVLLGGGGVSFEYAGEIRDEFPTKNVTVVHSRELLLNDVYPDFWRKQVNASLERRNIRLVLGERVDDIEPKNGVITTRSGKEIPADLVIPTRGPRPNTDFVASSLGTDSLTPSGHVKVLPTMQLVNHPRIFAAGDIVDWNEQKSARKAFGHAKIVWANLQTLLAAPHATNLTTYRGSYEALPLTNGRNGGTAYWGILWGITFGDWFTSRFASRNLYVDQVKRLMNL